jgi:hypothetical protein
MEIRTLGVEIRNFLHGLLGSRLNAHLEEELIRTRNDYETRLMERQQIICDQKELILELRGKVERYELVIIPLASPLGGFFAPKKERPPLQPEESAEQSWAEVKADWDRRQAEAEKPQ